MTRTTHTHGQWTVINGIVHVPHKTHHGNMVGYSDTAPITRRIDTMTGLENNANARLIAASPTMLEELETELVYIGQWKQALYVQTDAPGKGCPEFPGRIELIRKMEAREEEIRAAIAKAKGGQPC